MTKRRGSKTTASGLGGLVIVVIAGAILILKSDPSLQSSLPPELQSALKPVLEATLPSVAGTEAAGSSQPQTASGPAPAGMPAESFKQTPKEITFHGCPPEGVGGDPELNKNKNRVDEGNWQPVAFNTILNLPWPKDVERRDHANWAPADLAAIQKYEGFPVILEGYLALARESGPESTNCNSKDDTDFHIWVIDHAGGENDRPGSIVVEMTPRVRLAHAKWTVSNLNQIAKAGLPVRISGWTMFDPEHPDQIGQTRGTIWEVHPVMQLDVNQNGVWVHLDDF